MSSSCLLLSLNVGETHLWDARSTGLFFPCCIVFHCVNMAFVYPLTCWRTLGGFQFRAVMTICVHLFDGPMSFFLLVKTCSGLNGVTPLLILCLLGTSECDLIWK